MTMRQQSETGDLEVRRSRVVKKGVKIFRIAGPVILYGIFSSWVLGVIYLVVTGL